MRSLFAIAAAVLVTACLNSTHPAATTAQTRHDIARQIAAESGGQPARKIVEIEHVTSDSALVTTEDAGSRRQERWVKGEGGWKLDGDAGVAGSAVHNDNP